MPRAHPTRSGPLGGQRRRETLASPRHQAARDPWPEGLDYRLGGACVPPARSGSGQRGPFGNHASPSIAKDLRQRQTIDSVSAPPVHLGTQHPRPPAPAFTPFMRHRKCLDGRPCFQGSSSPASRQPHQRQRRPCRPQPPTANPPASTSRWNSEVPANCAPSIDPDPLGMARRVSTSAAPAHRVLKVERLPTPVMPPTPCYPALRVPCHSERPSG